MIAFFLFVFGLVVGSFLNVLAFRYDSEGAFFSPKKWGGRSHCLFCSQQLHWYELIPVISFLVQEGRCLVCRAKLAWQYPLVELASGLAFLLPLYILDKGYSLFYAVLWTIVFLIFILIWAIDARLSVIPDELNLVLGLLGLSLVDVYQGFSALAGFWLNHFIAGVVGGLLLGLIVFWSKGKGMGVGDVKLAIALGLLFGWPEITLVLGLAFIFGAVAGIYLLLSRKKGAKDAIPFGPFLVLGSLAVFFFGSQIVQSYFQFFNF